MYHEKPETQSLPFQEQKEGGEGGACRPKGSREGRIWKLEEYLKKEKEMKLMKTGMDLMKTESQPPVSINSTIKDDACWQSCT